MKPLEFTLSPELSHRLTTVLAPWRNANYEHGFQQRSGARLEMAQQLEQTLQLEGGVEGRAIMDALDGFMNESGCPAFMIHGLPTDTTGQFTIAEAFRQRLYCDPETHPGYFRGADQHDHSAPGFAKVGATRLHHDSDDFTLILTAQGGANPRSTALLNASELVDALVNHACAHTPRVSNALREQMARNFTYLLQLPLWIVSLDNNARREAEALGVLHVLPPASKATTAKRYYAPILLPNVQYSDKLSGSCSHKFLPTSFGNVGTRADAPDVASVDPAMRGAFHMLQAALKDVLDEKRECTTSDTPAAQTGDLLLLNNHLLLHAGGPFTHVKLHGTQRQYPGRIIRALDVRRGMEPDDYAVKPGDWREAIRAETSEDRAARLVKTSLGL